MNFYKAHYLAVITATLVLVACGGGSGGGGGGGFGGGLGPGPGDLSSLFELDPEVEAQVEYYYISVKSKSAFLNEDVVQTSEKYESLTGMYVTYHYPNDFYRVRLYAISPKGYIFDDFESMYDSRVGNLYNEVNQQFSMIFVPTPPSPLLGSNQI